MNSNSDIRSLERILSTLLNKQLQQICAAHLLKTSGVKADLQNRIKNALAEKQHSEPYSYGALRHTILSIRGGQPPQSSQNIPFSNMAPAPGTASQSQTQISRDKASRSFTISATPTPYQNENGYDYDQHPLFKQTPFYKAQFQIGQVHRCDVMNSHRNSVKITFKSGDFRHSLSNWPLEPSRRLMLFCGTALQGPQDVQFPHQSELKVNGEDVKANLRGLKNKPGTTLPVDITSYTRLKQVSYENSIDFTYALTTKTFYLALFVVEMTSIDDLVTKIKAKMIPKASVVREMAKKANDPDVVATSQVLSLLCPLSYTRLRVPCRSATCSHIQCFDANSYLQLQEQAPTWLCPICHKNAPFDTLAVDEYVLDILEHTSDSKTQVTIEPDGQWRKTERADSSQSRSGNSTKIDDDDDLSIVSHGIHTSTPLSRSIPSGGAPSGGYQGTPSASRSGSNKRSAEVIDLTLSSDEDDEPIIRPLKRQNRGLSASLGSSDY
ncbi:PINIT domain-containing protein [Durotheca rogersii]|uniref:PINIT domain-containing protein n=1 Tax=Durotheca rogersii TaxID=419775 RepID=UPI00221F2E0A|nr:PINIT domain-containing protein [Durotheca rogersii]KAI5868039.1 PINIT domain-containing protein [Durotheca rogersii]